MPFGSKILSEKVLGRMFFLHSKHFCRRYFDSKGDVLGCAASQDPWLVALNWGHYVFDLGYNLTG